MWILTLRQIGLMTGSSEYFFLPCFCSERLLISLSLSLSLSVCVAFLILIQSFDLKMKNYGVDVEELKAPKPNKRIFRAWIEDWEQPLLKKNDIVAEIRLCEKYKGLTF